MGDSAPLKLILSAEAGLSGTWEFTGPEAILIGRDQRCSIHPEAGEDVPGLSRFHTVIELGTSRAIVRDLGSPGGTWLNGHLIGRRTGSETRADSGQVVRGPGSELFDGDALACGPLWLRVILVDALYGRTLQQKGTHCPGCDRPLTVPTTLRSPDALCSRCRSNPLAALKLLQAGLARRISGLAPLKGLRIEKTLGHGATSGVFLVTRKKSETQLALKVMPPQHFRQHLGPKKFFARSGPGPGSETRQCGQDV